MGQAGKWANVDFTLCDPTQCDPENGLCPAAFACSRNILIQEDSDEEPMLISAKLCIGCADCVRACPLNAITILRGL